MPSTGSVPTAVRFLQALALNAINTEVGGIIASDTIWKLGGSPYGLTSTVKVLEGVTLTIEAGVEVSATDIESFDDMFLIHGTIVALGTETQPIAFDGKGRANFFSLDSSPDSAFLNVAYGVFRNGRAFWTGDGSAYFSLRNSMLTNLSSYSYIWYPRSDIIIEYNTFVNASGFSLWHSDAEVYIRYNRFESRYDSFPDYQDSWIIGERAPVGGATNVTRNSFLNTGEVAVRLGRNLFAAIDARNNYWGTTDKTTIESMITYENGAAGIVPFEPYLSEADSQIP